MNPCLFILLHISRSFILLNLYFFSKLYVFNPYLLLTKSLNRKHFYQKDIFIEVIIVIYIKY